MKKSFRALILALLSLIPQRAYSAAAVGVSGNILVPANNAVTLSCTGLTGCGAVTLGNTLSIAVPSVGSAGTYAYPASITTDAYGNASSITAGSAPAALSLTTPASVGTAAVGTGTTCARADHVHALAFPLAPDSLRFYRSTAAGSSWSANTYLGISSDAPSATVTSVIPWVAPSAGVIKNLRVFSYQNAPSNLNVTLYKASSATSPSYAATALVAAVASGTNVGSDTTHTVTVAAGDLILMFVDTTWGAAGSFGQAVTAQFYATATN